MIVVTYMRSPEVHKAYRDRHVIRSNHVSLLFLWLRILLINSQGTLGWRGAKRNSSGVLREGLRQRLERA